MGSVYRVTQIECPFHWLTADDRCYHFGDYTSGGGYKASDTNQWIHNLKKKPSVQGPQRAYKDQAVSYWADILRQLIPPANAVGDVTFVTIPGSKPAGHPDYDPRMQRVLERWGHGTEGIDIRDALVQTAERPAQHEDGARLTPSQIGEMIEFNRGALGTPFRSTVIVVDDVLTLGASFKAAQTMLATLPGVQSVQGLFLARTVWPNPFEEFFDADF